MLSTMSLKSKISLVVSILIMIVFFTVKTAVIFDIVPCSQITGYVEYGCFILFTLPFYIFVMEFIKTRDGIHNKVVTELEYKNTYLEHAAKILRHDMHSGINTYIPRGISSLERRLTPEVIRELKLEAPLRLLKEGLLHSQKVYRGVYEFTTLVKQGASINLQPKDLQKSLKEFLETTAYKDQVIIDPLPVVAISEPLFCTAVDNLIRNGLKYNDSDMKIVVISMLDDEFISIQDNGRGMTQEEFDHFSKTNTRRENQKESGSGLGLGICVAILKEHGFDVLCEKNKTGTRIKIRVRDKMNLHKWYKPEDAV